MKSFREQFSECDDSGYLKQTIFKSFEEHPEILPAFPKLNLLKKIESGRLKGLDFYVCGRFGGECSSKHKDCMKMRNVT